MHRPARTPAISTIAMFLIALIVCAFACAAGTSAHASQTKGLVTVEGKVRGRLQPGSTTRVEVTIRNRSQQARPVGEVILERIEADPRHASCPTSIRSADPDFSMPPIRVDETLPPGDRMVAAIGHLTMSETGVDQDACRGATLTLTFRAA